MKSGKKKKLKKGRGPTLISQRVTRSLGTHEAAGDHHLSIPFQFFLSTYVDLYVLK
jgi:hypothetical protein